MIVAMTAQQLQQLAVNGIVAGAETGLMAVGFALMLSVAGRFNFAYITLYVLGGYLAFTFSNPEGLGLNIWLGAVLAVICVSLISAGSEAFIFRPIARRAGPAAMMTVFIASLGLVIVGENVIRLVWGNTPLSFFPAMNAAGFQVRPIHIGDMVFTNVKLFRALTLTAAALGIAGVLRWTSLGRSIKATRSNPGLAVILGIPAERIYLVVLAIAGACAALSGFWGGVEFALLPNMGGHALFYAVVAAFLAGPASSPVRVFITGVILVFIEQFSSIWIQTQRSQLVVFVILMGYLLSLSLDLGRYVRPLRKGSAA